MDTAGQKKWDARYTNAASDIPEAAAVLSLNQHLLPATGKALDLACGRGGNALLLAKAGFVVSAWDFSTVALEQLSVTASQAGLKIQTEVRDVLQLPPQSHEFDVITVSRYLERTLFPILIDALRPDGVLFYQTFTQQKSGGGGPGNRNYLLEENELLDVFGHQNVLSFRDEGLQGNIDKGLRNESWIVVKKRSV